MFESTGLTAWQEDLALGFSEALRKDGFRVVEESRSDDFFAFRDDYRFRVRAHDGTVDISLSPLFDRWANSTQMMLGIPQDAEQYQVFWLAIGTFLSGEKKAAKSEEDPGCKHLKKLLPTHSCPYRSAIKGDSSPCTCCSNCVRDCTYAV